MSDAPTLFNMISQYNPLIEIVYETIKEIEETEPQSTSIII
jgi:hypothetical protein